MKNTLIVIVIIIVLGLGLRVLSGEDNWVCDGNQWIKHGNPNSPAPTTGCGIEKPPIVDMFACGDYCPGPQEKYMVKIYEGIQDDVECLKIGGYPASFTGWGVTKYCAVENPQPEKQP